MYLYTRALGSEWNSHNLLIFKLFVYIISILIIRIITCQNVVDNYNASNIIR